MLIVHFTMRTWLSGFLFPLMLQNIYATATVNRNNVFSGTERYDVSMMAGGSVIQRRNPSNKQTADVYCYPGVEKSLVNLFKTVKFHIHINSDDYRQYMSGTPAEVFNLYVHDTYGWNINPFKSRQPRSITLDPFNSTCLIVSTKEIHDVELQIVGVDLWRVSVLLAGLSLFFLSRSLSANPFFFYLCGIIVGVCASFMVLVYYGSKLFPQKTLTYGVMLGGWTVGAFIFQQMWSNLSRLVVSYRTHVFWYTLVVGLLSFMACYRIGPPRDQRSKDLVMWTLQAIGLVLVFICSNYQEATAALIILCLVIQYFPNRLQRAIKGFWLRRFPPKRRLLTSEEYYEEGARETKDALDSLRKYCSSPDCAQWKIMLKLNDSQRFASFVEGESHLSDSEVLDYEAYAFSSLHQPNISSDDSSATSSDED